jgi:hypothetical protein
MDTTIPYKTQSRTCKDIDGEHHNGDHKREGVKDVEESQWIEQASSHRMLLLPLSYVRGFEPSFLGQDGAGYREEYDEQNQ